MWNENKKQNEIGQWKTEVLSKALFAKIDPTVSQFRQTSVLNLIKAKNPKADLITGFISKNRLILTLYFNRLHLCKTEVLWSLKRP